MMPRRSAPSAVGTSSPGVRRPRARRLRVAWAVLSLFVVESAIVALAALPAVAFWTWHLRWAGLPPWLRVVLLAMAFVPAYLLFAVGVMVYSAAATRALGWRTPSGIRERVADLAPPLLDWGRYLATIHVVRVLAGAVFRSTPVWTMYLRLNGARVGRGVWVNSLALMDHNLLEIGDGAVVGSDAHVAAHIVEGGVLTTAPVRIGRRATVGIGCVLGIGVEVGDDTQVGALSVVPKFARLAPRATYAGAPARRLTDREVQHVTPAQETDDAERHQHQPLAHGPSPRRRAPGRRGDGA